MKKRRGFSLIEVVFVLIILGIVSSISSQIIVQVYDNYITQKALYKTTTKTELAINQIVNRLSYVIDGTTIAKDPKTTIPYTKSSEDTNWVRLNAIPSADTNFTAIEWIGYDYDSFSAGAIPYWSGIANYETATKDRFSTPASKLSKVSKIMNNLSNGDVDLSSASQKPAIIFIQKAKKYRDIVGEEGNYDPACMGLINENNTSCIFRVSMIDDTNLSFPDGKPKIVSERYKLAWSAYALVPEDRGSNGLFNIYLYYNYQPWHNETYKNGKKKMLISNVSVFKFTENGGVIQLKICAVERIGGGETISSCKEKAIIR